MEEGIEGFLTFLSEERGFSPNTIAAYRNDLYQLARFVENRAVGQWSDIDHSRILGYFLSLRERSYALSTMARKVAAMRTFFGFQIAKGVIEQDPTKGLSRPQVRKSLPKVISVHEVEELLRQPGKRSTPEAKRDRAMLELLCATGIRVSELIALNIGDINLKVGRLCCVVKGEKERYIDFHQQAARAVEEYLDEARSRLLRNQQEVALFLNRRGERLTRQGFWLILKTYAKEAKIKAEITPHTLRHSVAIHLLRSGKMNLRELQEFLGHANISTTQIYEKALSQGEL